MKGRNGKGRQADVLLMLGSLQEAFQSAMCRKITLWSTWTDKGWGTKKKRTYLLRKIAKRKLLGAYEGRSWKAWQDGLHWQPTAGPDGGLIHNMTDPSRSPTAPQNL